MNQVMKPWHHVPVGRAVPVLTDAERMEAKRREKMQAHASSHRVGMAGREADKAASQDGPSEVDRLLG